MKGKMINNFFSKHIIRVRIFLSLYTNAFVRWFCFLGSMKGWGCMFSDIRKFSCKDKNMHYMSRLMEQTVFSSFVFLSYQRLSLKIFSHCCMDLNRTLDKCGCSGREIIHVWQFLLVKVIWHLDFTHCILYLQNSLHNCIYLNETWHIYCITRLCRCARKQFCRSYCPRH